MADEDREAESDGLAGRSLPTALLAYLGSEPEQLVGYGRCSVWRGNRAVAKVGAGAACEAHVLSGRVGSLPIATPQLIAEDPDWVVMREIANDPTPWSQDDLIALLPDLAALHDHFDAIDPDRIGPLPVGARRAADRLRVYGRGDLVALPTALAAMLDDPEPLLALLETQPRTLVHGDPYPQNVLRPTATGRVWVDWEDAHFGPATLDLAAFMGNGPWLLGRSLPRDECLEVYGDALGRHPPAFERSLDAAVLLWTLSQNLDGLRREKGVEAFDAFVAERMAALERLGL